MKKTGLLHLVSMLLFFLCSMNLNAKGSNSFGQLLNPVMGVNALSETNEDETSLNNIVTHSDVNIVWTNDETYPWTIPGSYAKNGNCGVRYSTSSLTMAFSSTHKTELSFDWLSRNYSDHSALQLFIDGVEVASISNSSYTTQRRLLESGEHIVVFKDSIGNSTSTSNYSYVQNVVLKEVLPLENSVLTSKSNPLTFDNEGTWPWTIEDGYIQNSNYGNNNSTSSFSTDFTITEPSKFSFWSSTYYYDSNNKTQTSSGYYYSSNKDYHRFMFTINGEPYLHRRTYGSGTTYLLLEPGDYHLEWTEDIADDSYSNFQSRIKDIELSSDWVEVDLGTTPGSLGVEVLYLVDVLSDVELLKVSGVMNATDWATIKQMKNLIGLDLTGAKFDAVPESAFSGLSLLSSVKLPEGLKTIDQYAFRGTQILSIDIPSTVTSIGKMAFSGTRIKSVNFRENTQLTRINDGAFFNCTSLREMFIPNTVTYVGNAAFYGCTSLRTIEFPDAITVINDYTCSDCSALTSLHLPKNLQTIGYYSFNNTPNLTKFEIPSTVDRIKDYAFYNNGLDSLSLPITLRYLHQYSFAKSKNLKYIEMPSYLERGSSYMTYYYVSGDNIYSSSTTRYYGYNLNFEDCTALEKIVCRSATPPSIVDDPFSRGPSKSKVTLAVPSFAVVNYKLDPYWMQFGTITEGDDVDYWKITSNLALTNNRRMQGTPDIDLYYDGKFTVGGNAPMPVGQFNYYVSESNPGCLINNCPAMTADAVNTQFSVSANTWYFFCPIHDVDLSKVSHSANASFVFRFFDADSRAEKGTGSSWKNVTDNTLHAGQGYIFHCNAAGTLTLPADAEGRALMFAYGDVTKNLEEHVAETTANHNWNYVGNPYPAFYDIYYMDFTAPITVWTGSTYKAYSIVDDQFALRPMQPFFVQKPDKVDAITFHKEGRQMTSTIDRPSYSVHRVERATEDRHFFNLAMTGENGIVDETRVVINPDASESYEMMCDASKFLSMEATAPQIFSIDASGTFYAINERPIADGLISLGYYVGEEGFYTISVYDTEGKVFLIDNKLNKTIDLKSQEYFFYSEATDGVDTTRFSLVLALDHDITTGISPVVASSSKATEYDLLGRPAKAQQTGIHLTGDKAILRK